MKNIIAYGVPLHFRSEIVEATSRFASVIFPSILNNVDNYIHKILSNEDNIVAVWDNIEPEWLTDFLAQYPEVVVADIHPISMENPVKGEIEVIGVRFSPRNHNVKLFSSVRGDCTDDDISKADLIIDILNGKTIDGIDRLNNDHSLLFVLPRTDRKISSDERGAFLEAIIAEHPNMKIVLCSVKYYEWFEFIQVGSVHAVIEDENPSTHIFARSKVLTNRHECVKYLSENGADVHTKLTFEGWDDFHLNDDELDNRLEVLRLESSGLQRNNILIESVFFKSYAGEYSEGYSDISNAALVIEELNRAKKSPIVRFAVPENEVIPTSKIPYKRLNKEYDVEVFDDRGENATLTCILPFRFATDRPDALSRLRYASMDSSLSKDVNFIVVDDGSAPEIVEEIRSKCKEFSFSYIRLNTVDLAFSVGRCRNVGAEYSRSKFIFMQDIDLMPYDGFYRDLLLEMEAQGMYENARHFMMIPYIFLTKEGTDQFNRTKSNLRRQKFIHAALVNDKSVIEKFSTGTSANVYNRAWYLSRGGNSSDFEGWGYEDLEFNTRMIRHLGMFPLPADWSTEKYNFNSVLEYKTYKSLYRLFGDMSMMKGIALFHAWHPVIKSGDYMEKAAANRDIFIKKLASFPKTHAEPDPLADRSKGRTLVFRKNAFTLSRTSAPMFGDVFFLPHEEDIPNRVTLENFVKDNYIDRIVFFNPYQTHHMMKIQTWARELNIKFVVAERGALPNSNFFDPNGFLWDSISYKSEVWNKPLSIEQTHKVQDYTRDLRLEKPALEAQSKSIGGHNLKKKLGIPDDKIVIFVPLQRPGDTVTRYFTRDMEYLEFEDLVADFAAKLPDNVRLLIKTHPLEDNNRDWGSADIVNDINVYDLIEACDFVWTFNSGTGVLAMAWGKFCAMSGNAFYQADGVNQAVNCVSDIINLSENLPTFDHVIADRFIYHLAFNLYSFGDHVTKPVRMDDGSRMTATLDIKYSTLRILGEEEVFDVRHERKYDTSGILFDRYRYAMTHKK